MNKRAYIEELSESGRLQYEDVSFAEQRPAQKIFSAVWELLYYLEGDGLWDVFANSYGVLIDHIQPALKEIGALAAADAVERAVLLARHLRESGEDYDWIEWDSDEDDRADAIETMNAELVAQRSEIVDRLFDFIASQPVEFGPIPSNIQR